MPKDKWYKNRREANRNFVKSIEGKDHVSSELYCIECGSHEVWMQTGKRDPMVYRCSMCRHTIYVSLWHESMDRVPETHLYIKAS